MCNVDGESLLSVAAVLAAVAVPVDFRLGGGWGAAAAAGVSAHTHTGLPSETRGRAVSWRVNASARAAAAPSASQPARSIRCSEPVLLFVARSQTDRVYTAFAPLGEGMAPSHRQPTVSLLHPPLHSSGFPICMEGEC